MYVHMALLGMLTGGFCMVSFTNFGFSAPDAIFGAPGPGLGVRRPGSPKMWPEEYAFCGGIDPPLVCPVFVCKRNGLYDA